MIKRIRDNTKRIDQNEFKDIKNLIDKVADKTLERLDQEDLFIFPESIDDSPDLDKNQMILEYKDDCYNTGNVMGFIGRGNEELVISSRFSSGDKNDYFLQYLLSNVLDLPNIVDLKTTFNDNDEIFDLMVFLFPYFLRQALRKGPYKTYIRKHYNDANVRGIIDIPQFIKKDIPFLGKIAYTQREYSYDNDLMELIRHTIEFIRTKPYGRKLLHKVKDEVNIVIQATPDYSIKDRHKIIIQNTENPVRHAYYKEYRNLQRICLMILRHHTQKMNFAYTDKHVYGVLFDGAWLWEEYLNNLVSDVFYHPRNKAKENCQQLFSSDRQTGRIYPDFIGKNTDNRIIADAKYKPADNIHNKDYLQVLAYMFRFDAKQGYYLYPESESITPEVMFLNSGSTYENNVVPRNDISVTKYGFHIPSGAENYKQFCDMMKKSEESFRKEFKSV